jgi:3-oxosteroid 1-dehydrogenase
MMRLSMRMHNQGFPLSGGAGQLPGRLHQRGHAGVERRVVGVVGRARQEALVVALEEDRRLPEGERLVPGEPLARILVIEKSLPGSIMVNKRGRRFVNEAAPYIDVVNSMYKTNTADAPCIPAYLVFDATYRKKYPCGPVLQASQQPDWMLPKALKNYFKKADTLDALAAQLGVDAATLEATVAKFNQYARAGKDLDFQRGETVFDRYYGDEKIQPNACLAPIETPPFYGLETYPGELGTKGGLKTDASAHVLTESGQPVAGLYAIGNCSASVMGHSYPGAGATIGPAMTFGYIAARDAIGGRKR